MHFIPVSYTHLDVYKRQREKEGISYGAGSFIDVPLNNDVASWGYYAILNPTKRDAVENALKEEVAKALKDGFTQEELDANKKSFSNQRTTTVSYTHLDVYKRQVY